jgi:hypothetical protein
MTFHSDPSRSLSRAGLVALMLVLAGCQSGGVGGLFGLGEGGDKPRAEADRETITRTELLAYCPNVTLREGTAYYNTYAKAPPGEPQDDRANIIYQASLSEATRNCRYGDGQLTMTVALAGRVVPGPKGKPGNINLPIRVVVMRGSEVLYSRLHKHPVAIPSITGATQYVFTDSSITVPAPTAANYLVYAGFDEGPYDTP